LRSRPATRAKRVFIIDDDPGFVVPARLALRKAGYTVGQCGDIGPALDYLRRFGPDVVIIDVMMKTGSAGFHVVREIRGDPASAYVPILVATSIHRTTPFRFSPEADGELLPVQKVIDKPVPPETLVEEVAALCGRSGRAPQGSRSRKEN
jgi:DNA-binding response OmpR family regulator